MPKEQLLRHLCDIYKTESSYQSQKEVRTWAAIAIFVGISSQVGKYSNGIEALTHSIILTAFVLFLTFVVIMYMRKQVNFRVSTTNVVHATLTLIDLIISGQKSITPEDCAPAIQTPCFEKNENADIWPKCLMESIVKRKPSQYINTLKNEPLGYALIMAAMIFSLVCIWTPSNAQSIDHKPVAKYEQAVKDIDSK